MYTVPLDILFSGWGQPYGSITLHVYSIVKMSKQIRRRLEIIEDHFGKMALRDFVQVDGGPDTPLHKAAHGGECARLKVRVLEYGYYE